MRKLYDGNKEQKTLGEWIKQVNLYDVRLTFADGSTKQTITIAYSTEHAAYNGMHMNFGKGLAVKSEVLGWQDITIKKFRELGYTPSNISLIEIQG